MNTFGGYSCLVVAFLLFAFTDLSASQSFGELFQMSANAYNDEKTKPMKMPVQNALYDFIIVGAGPGGCVTANRLSETWSVLLLEAGATESFVNEIPVLAVSLQTQTEGNWKDKTTPQKRACRGMKENRCAVSQGKLLGGSTSVGSMIYSRGNKEDYDKMAADGNYEWSYFDVLQYFKRSEKASLGGWEYSEYHNTSGLQSVEHSKRRTTIGEAFVKASKESGYDEVDYNGHSQIGTSFVQATTKNGRRHSAAEAFIKPILNERKNLDVITFAHVTKILIDRNGVAYGVQFLHRNITYTVRSKKEVILSAGTFRSAQLLMLSGIGPRDELQRVGIQPLVDLPVGKRSYEHMSHVGLVFTTNTVGQSLFIDQITSNDIAQYQAGSPSTKLSVMPCIEALTYHKIPNSVSNDKRPDVEIVIVPGSLASDFGTFFKDGANFKDEVYTEGYKPLVGRDHFTLVVVPLYPKSVGNVTLEDKNPLSGLVINPNYFAAAEDVDVMLAGIKEALRIIDSPAMRKLNATIYDKVVPGCEGLEFGTTDYWKCSIQVMSYTKHHHVGTCRMGPSNDNSAVVSPQLKVHGIRKLRVVDASVIPEPISSHVAASVYMIGEKAADMIRKEWEQKPLSIAVSL